MRPGIVYVKGNVFYGKRSDFFTEEDLVNLLRGAKFIGPQDSHDEESGIVDGCYYDVFVNF
jgi:hypothetical protein